MLHYNYLLCFVTSFNQWKEILGSITQRLYFYYEFSHFSLMVSSHLTLPSFHFFSLYLWFWTYIPSSLLGTCAVMRFLTLVFRIFISIGFSPDSLLSMLICLLCWKRTNQHIYSQAKTNKTFPWSYLLITYHLVSL